MRIHFLISMFPISLLLLCGEIHPNPGPNRSEMCLTQPGRIDDLYT